MRPMLTKRGVLLGVLPLVAVGGCGPNAFYLPSLAVGQIDLMLNSIPIVDAIDGGELSGDQVAQLELILDVRAYARDTMALTVGNSYTLFYDNARAARIYNVSASDQDRFRAMTWTFPIVGTVPYLGFFDEELAADEERALIEQGFDTFTYEVDAYSTLGFLPNPVRASFLERDTISLTDTVIHELLHSTAWRPGDTEFNESLATFVGRTGALEYLGGRFGADSAITREAISRFEDSDRFNAFMFDLYEQLDTFYNSDIGYQEKIAGREEIFESARSRFMSDIQSLMNVPENYQWVERLPSNNAWMLANYRYNLDLVLFERVHEATGLDWPLTINVFQEATAAGDPKVYLRDWLGDDLAPRAGRGTRDRTICVLSTNCLIGE